MNKGTEHTEPLKIFRCPECGEQLLDGPERNPRTGEYERGHYHDPPADWPGGEDPWFKAEEVIVIPQDSPNVLSVDEAKRVVGYLEDSPWTAGNELSCRLQDFATSENPESTEEGMRDD